MVSKKSVFPKYISLGEAARQYGYTRDHLGYLIRKGELKGQKLGAFYFTTDEWLQDYLSTGLARKSLPKGVKKVNRQKNSSPAQPQERGKKPPPIRIESDGRQKQALQPERGMDALRRDFERRLIGLDEKMAVLERKIFKLTQDMNWVRNGNRETSSDRDKAESNSSLVMADKPMDAFSPREKSASSGKPRGPVDGIVVRSALLDELWSRPRGVFLSYFFVFLFILMTLFVVNPLLLDDLKLLNHYIVSTYSNIGIILGR